MHLITGGSGLTGASLADSLVRLGEKVRILDTRVHERRAPDGSIEFIRGDLRSVETVKNACENVDVVFHLGAIQPLSRAKADVFRDINVLGTRNILEGAVQSGVSKVVYVSSSIVYGIPTSVPCGEGSELRPIGEYGRTKLEAERLCERYFDRGLDITIIRPRTIVGPGRLGLFWILFDWVRRGKRIYLIGDGKNHFQFVSLGDMVEACKLAWTRGSGQVFNIGASKIATVREEIGSLIVHANTKSKVTPLNASLVRATLAIMRWLGASPLVEEHYLVADRDFVLDTTRARNILGWTPKHSNLDSLIHAYDWYLTNYENIPLEYQGVLKLVRYFS